MRVEAMIGVDVLAEQGDLAHARASKARDLVENRSRGPRGLGAASIRHDAERAELVAALLHGHEGGNATPTNRVGRRRRQLREFVVRRKFSVHDAGTDASLAQELRQAMIALRTNDNIDGRLAAQDFASLSLGNAAGDDQHRPPAFPRAFFLQLAELAQLGKNFLRGAFADVTGVENDEIGILDPESLTVTSLGGEVAHSLRVIDIHLASE